jgi:hypothetical protein
VRGSRRYVWIIDVFMTLILVSVNINFLSARARIQVLIYYLE